MNGGLSFDEMKKRLDVMLNAGLLDRATYERRLDAARGVTREPVRSGVRQSSAPRVDQSAIASAPYRFVPIAAGWVKAAAETTGPLDAPKPDGYMAEIEVEFTVESPLLIGGENGERGDVQPMSLDGGAARRDWIIPGSTLRGWLRSELEIVAFARLDQYNRNRAFGLRDFDHAGYGTDRYPVADVAKLKAGWIRKVDRTTWRDRCDAADANGLPRPSEYEIAECPAWYVVQAESIVRLFRPRGKPDFTQNDLLAKYDAVGAMAWAGKARVIDLDAALKNCPLVEAGTEINGKPHMKILSDRGGGRRGHFVFSGRAPNGKRLEYWFDAPKAWSDCTWHPLSEARWDRFEDLNATRVGDDVRPQGSYEAVVPTLESGRPVPVFFVGDLAPSDPSREIAPFAFGLTRLFKVPHRYDLRAVVERSGHERPKLLPREGDGKRSRIDVDFVENLFGYVHEPDEWEGGPQDGSAQPRDFARKGRIAVEAARIVAAQATKMLPSVGTVMAAAKPSFAPFYLVGPCKDYSDDKAKIAGRKVYLPRFGTRAVAEGTTPAEVERLLQRQIDAIRASAAPGKEFNDKILTRLCFLDPGRAGAHPKFRSRIRFANATAEEIGAVVWVLTHGGSTRHRHMIGRAKGFGAGQVAVAVTKIDAVPLFPEGTVSGGPGAPVRPTGETASDAAAFRARFERFMEGAVKTGMTNTTLPGWKTSATVVDWLAARDPDVGARLAAAGHLDTMPLRGGQSGRENPYKLLRDMTKPRKDGRPTAGPDRFLDLGKR